MVTARAAISGARRGGTPEFAEPRSVIIIIARLIIGKGGKEL